MISSLSTSRQGQLSSLNFVVCSFQAVIWFRIVPYFNFALNSQAVYSGDCVERFMKILGVFLILKC